MGTSRNDRGAALMIAVLCMLILAIFAVSMAVLADLETRVGGNYKAAQQALALAEAGLEQGRDILKGATSTTPPSFNTFISSASARRLGVPAAGISLGAGHYWVRVDNDCDTPGGGTWNPKFVPTDIRDGGAAGCQEDVDTNNTVVLTAWAETTDGAGRVIGRARVRAHYTMDNAWGHSCYNGNNQLCTQDDVGGCNNNPCVDPSDPRNPHGPGKGSLPQLTAWDSVNKTGVACGKQSSGGQIPDSDIPTDVASATGWSSTWPCVIYPYYTWALHQALPARSVCRTVISSSPGYGTNNCSSTSGTIAWDPSNTACTTAATASKCHGAVFFGPGNRSTAGSNVVTGADVSFGTSGSDDAGPCIGVQPGPVAGKQKDWSTENCYDSTISASTSAVVYVMGKVTVKNNVGVLGTLVLHGDQAGGGGSHDDLGLTGTAQLSTHSCVAGSPAPAPGCGYPLAILAYNPNESVPTTSTGQTINLNLSDSTATVHGIIFTGGTSSFGPINVDGGIIGWDVNIGNTATRITYNSTYGNAAEASPPPGFTSPSSDPGWTVALYPATWVRCVNYANDYNAPTPCQSQ
jgi:Tfp pilus assembly protein PilX